MENELEIMNLLKQKQELTLKLNTLIYGSVEIRENENKKYIYVHYREDGIPNTKYVGEYSDSLYNLILNNSNTAKTIKKDIKNIEKELKKLNYTNQELDLKVEVNIDFAKRHMVDTIYKQAVLEGIDATYHDIESIINNGKINNMLYEDIMKVVNLKHAWEFILNPNVLLTPTNFSLLCQINKLVEEGFYYTAGKIRSTPVTIGGTNWQPDIPIESIIKEDLDNILNKKISDVDKSIELLLYVMKKQIFIDGNKRTALIFANQFLISKGKGIIAIPAEETEEFKKLLISYYENKDNVSIKKFLKDKCYINIK